MNSYNSDQIEVVDLTCDEQIQYDTWLDQAMNQATDKRIDSILSHAIDIQQTLNGLVDSVAKAIDRPIKDIKFLGLKQQGRDIPWKDFKGIKFGVHLKRKAPINDDNPPKDIRRYMLRRGTNNKYRPTGLNKKQ